MLEVKNKRGRKRTAVGTAPRDFHPRVILTRPYSLPATPRCLKTVVRSDYDDKGVPLFLLYVLARKLPHLLYGEGVDRSLPKGGRGVPAARLGTEGMYPSALYCRGVIGRAFFEKVQKAAAWKGELNTRRQS